MLPTSVLLNPNVADSDFTSNIDYVMKKVYRYSIFSVCFLMSWITILPEQQEGEVSLQADDCELSRERTMSWLLAWY